MNLKSFNPLEFFLTLSKPLVSPCFPNISNDELHSKVKPCMATAYISCLDKHLTQLTQLVVTNLTQNGYKG